MQKSHGIGAWGCYLLILVIGMKTAGGDMAKAKFTVVAANGEGETIPFPLGSRERITLDLGCRIKCESCDPNGVLQFSYRSNYILLCETCIAVFRYSFETGNLDEHQELTLNDACIPKCLVPSSEGDSRVLVLCHTGQSQAITFNSRTDEFEIEQAEPLSALNPVAGTIVSGKHFLFSSQSKDYHILRENDGLLSIYIPQRRALVLPDGLCDNLIAVYPLQRSNSGNPRVLLDCTIDTTYRRSELTIDIDNGYDVTIRNVDARGFPLPVVTPGYVALIANTTLTIYTTTNYVNHNFKDFGAPIQQVIFLDSETTRLAVLVANQNQSLVDVPTFVTGEGVEKLPHSVPSCPVTGACVSPAVVVSDLPDSTKYYAIFTMETSHFTVRVYNLTDPSKMLLEITDINTEPAFAILNILEIEEPTTSTVIQTPTSSEMPATTAELTSSQPTAIPTASPATEMENNPVITEPPTDAISSPSKGSFPTIIVAVCAATVLVMILLSSFSLLCLRKRCKKAHVTYPIQQQRPNTEGGTATVIPMGPILASNQSTSGQRTSSQPTSNPTSGQQVSSQPTSNPTSGQQVSSQPTSNPTSGQQVSSQPTSNPTSGQQVSSQPTSNPTSGQQVSSQPTSNPTSGQQVSSQHLSVRPQHIVPQPPTPSINVLPATPDSTQATIGTPFLSQPSHLCPPSQLPPTPPPFLFPPSAARPSTPPPSTQHSLTPPRRQRSATPPISPNHSPVSSLLTTPASTPSTSQTSLDLSDRVPDGASDEEVIAIPTSSSQVVSPLEVQSEPQESMCVTGQIEYSLFNP